VKRQHLDKKFPSRPILAALFGAVLAASVATPDALAAPRDVKVRWQLSPDADVTKYRIHRGTRAGQYDTVVEVSSFTPESSGQASTILSGLDSTLTYYLAISAVDAAGQTSTLSNEISLAAAPAPAPAPGPDMDGDGLSDAQEAALGTQPGNPDTDADGMRDGDEVRVGRNPLVDEIKLLIILFQYPD
jgi:hypothetical protein